MGSHNYSLARELSGKSKSRADLNVPGVHVW